MLSNAKFWFVAGTQLMYGESVLQTVEARAREMAHELSRALPCELIYKDTAKTAEQITEICTRANAERECAGIVVWMHTFSPAKMWLNGLSLLQKPYLHLHTQYNRNIPNQEIDMDYMNLNQSAHGDREHGFIAARLRIPRKVVAGYWRDGHVHGQIGQWMRAAAGVMESRSLKVVRFGDNMRHVAVTEGDKIEAQRAFGWQVNTIPVGELAAEIAAVGRGDIACLMAEYAEKYTFNTQNTDSVRLQAAQELAIERVLRREGARAFTNTFEDLYGLDQLPGLATQRLMEKGYGYGGEGDWKTAALTRVIKAMTEGMPGGTSFMEDYTYDLEPGAELTLGAHMLEVCPSLAAERPRIEVHELSIGGKNPPARLVFEGRAGRAVNVTMCDMGGRMRLIVHDIECVRPSLSMPRLPVARLMWRSEPDFETAVKAWIYAGGGHHTALSMAAGREMLADWADMCGIECVHIGEGTDIDSLKNRLMLADLVWRLHG